MGKVDHGMRKALESQKERSVPRGSVIKTECLEGWGLTQRAKVTLEATTFTTVHAFWRHAVYRLVLTIEIVLRCA